MDAHDKRRHDERIIAREDQHAQAGANFPSLRVANGERGRRPGFERHARRLGASAAANAAAHREACARARQHHRGDRADQGAGVRLRRPARARRRAALVERRRLPPVHRHPQQPTHEVHAGQRRERGPRADQPRERAHARSAGSAALVRTRHAAGDAARTRRRPHRSREQLSGAPPQIGPTTWW